jgi:CTP:molybdopterin cytidylyltransferase MocA
MDEPMRVAAVILAAGASTRFGSPKQLARIGDRSMLEVVIGVAREAGLHPIIAVVPPGFAVPDDVVPVINAAPEAGISRSLQLGIHSVPPDVDAAVVLLGDQPTLAVATVQAVLGADAGYRPVVAATADGRFAPPVLLKRKAFALVDAAVGDAGLVGILAAQPDLVVPVEVGRHVPDVDTPADLERLT